jgi:hypothetical protein
MYSANLNRKHVLNILMHWDVKAENIAPHQKLSFCDKRDLTACKSKAIPVTGRGVP